MIELRLEGLHYEIGLSIGEKWRNSVSSCCSEKCSKDKLDFAYECQRSVEKHWPDLLEELQEIYEGELREFTICWAWIASLEEDKVYLCEVLHAKTSIKNIFCREMPFHFEYRKEVVCREHHYHKSNE